MRQSLRLVSWTSIIATFVFGSIALGQNQNVPGIRAREPLTILSANDGQSHRRLTADGHRDTVNITADGITVVHLGPDHPPIVNTVYGTVPNSIFSVPYLPITPHGHYGFVSSRGLGRARAGSLEPANLLSVVDLTSRDLTVIQTVELTRPGTGVMHPNGKHLVVPYTNGLRVYGWSGSKLEVIRDNAIPFGLGSIDISPRGDRLVAIETEAADTILQAPRIPKTVHVFSYEDGRTEHLTEISVTAGLPRFDRPFAPRFSPDGARVLVLNGGGTGTKGKLDALLSIDMRANPPTVSEAVLQLADGMEGVAFHPSGRMAVIACLEETSAPNPYSHLAVIDLTSKPMRLLYELTIDPIPEGIEFSPDGSQLFVQSTLAHHISVFDVDGFLLRRSPFVIRVGHGPAAMGIARRRVR